MRIIGVLVLVVGMFGGQMKGQQPSDSPGASTAGQSPAQFAGDFSEGGSARRAPATALSGLAGLDEDSGRDTYRDLPQIPALLGGRGMSVALLTEMERSNYLKAGFNVGAAYDDNPLLLPSGVVGNVSGSIFPNLSLERTTSRSRLNLGYAGGLTINQRLTSQNQGSHSFNFDAQFRVTPHVNLRLADSFQMVTGVFDSGSGAVGTGGGGQNGSVLIPLATQKANLSVVETNYHFALHDLVGASGSFYDLRFDNSPNGLSLANTQTASGTAFWLHRLFRGDWGGASYRFQRITFDPSGQARVHSFLLTNTLKSNHLTANLFAGPEYSENWDATGPHANRWSMAGGIEAGWQDERTGVSAGYSRGITDGGGVLGTVRLQNVYANFRRQIVPGWAASLTASHGINDAIGTTSTVRLTSAGVSLERNIPKGFGFRVSYTHDFQERELAAPPQLSAQRNRFVATLSYQWTRPLGM